MESLIIINPKSSVSSSSSPSPSPSPISANNNSRLWRPAAQRNVRNQWSKLASSTQLWTSSSNTARSHATCLTNTVLSIKYMPAIQLGGLRDMLNIKDKASSKLIKQHELLRSNLLSSYKDMVSAVTSMVNISRSMRCFSKGSSSLAQFASSSEDKNDPGDGGGIPVFAFLAIPTFEKLAEELVHMFQLELVLKRLLVLELLSLSCEKDPKVNELSWSAELYPGEFNELSTCNLYSKDTCEPIHPSLEDGKFDIPVVQCKRTPNREVLQVYLTTWLADVNIDNHRVDEIFAIIGEEMHQITQNLVSFPINRWKWETTSSSIQTDGQSSQILYPSRFIRGSATTRYCRSETDQGYCHSTPKNGLSLVRIFMRKDNQLVSKNPKQTGNEYVLLKIEFLLVDHWKRDWFKHSQYKKEKRLIEHFLSNENEWKNDNLLVYSVSFFSSSIPLSTSYVVNSSRIGCSPRLLVVRVNADQVSIRLILEVQ
ncbi:hypothetical protein ACFE04_009737 [Oxalis oulophora]